MSTTMLKVSRIKDDGAAARAGIQVDDILCAYDGSAITTIDSLSTVVSDAVTRGADQVNVRLLRGAQFVDISVATGVLGVELRDIAAEPFGPQLRVAESNETALPDNSGRATVRALAERYAAELRAVARSGGNVYQKGLDQDDSIQAMAAAMPEEEATAFLVMYAEEVNACALQTMDETNRIIDEGNQAVVRAQVNSANVQAIFSLLGFFAFIFVLIAIFKR